MVIQDDEAFCGEPIKWLTHIMQCLQSSLIVVSRCLTLKFIAFHPKLEVKSHFDNLQG